jgi:hypothetical protein
MPSTILRPQSSGEAPCQGQGVQVCEAGEGAVRLRPRPHLVQRPPAARRSTAVGGAWTATPPPTASVPWPPRLGSGCRGCIPTCCATYVTTRNQPTPTALSGDTRAVISETRKGSDTFRRRLLDQPQNQSRQPVHRPRRPVGQRDPHQIQAHPLPGFLAQTGLLPIRHNRRRPQPFKVCSREAHRRRSRGALPIAPRARGARAPIADGRQDGQRPICSAPITPPQSAPLQPRSRTVFASTQMFEPFEP